MQLTIDLSLNDSEVEQLAGTLACNKEQLPATFGRFATAAAQEYARMMLGQKVFTRGRDIQEYRLFLIVRHAFDEVIPNEQQISGLFQTTASESGALVRSVMSKYQYELQNAINGTCRSVLEGVHLDSAGGLSVVIASSNLVGKLNLELAGIDGTLPQIAKKRGTVSTYFMEKSSYRALCQFYGVAPIEES